MTQERRQALRYTRARLANKVEELKLQAQVNKATMAAQLQPSTSAGVQRDGKLPESGIVPISSVEADRQCT
jgi:hypothetical protein